MFLSPCCGPVTDPGAKGVAIPGQGVGKEQGQLALRILGFYIHGLNQPWMENTWKKIPKSFRKQNMNLPHAGNYLHSVDIALGIMRNLEMI